MSKSSPLAQAAKPYHFNKSTARANQAKSVAIRLTKPKPNSTASIASQNLSYTEFTISFTSHAQQTLQRFIVLMDKLRSPKSIYYMAQSMEKVFGIWAHLTQTPAPGQLRPEKMKKLLREYGMKSAIANAMAQPDPTTPNAAAESPTHPNTGDLSPQIPASEAPITNTNESIGLTHDLSPPITNQQPPELHTPTPTETDQSILKHSFPQADPVPTPGTPTPERCNATE